MTCHTVSCAFTTAISTSQGKGVFESVFPAYPLLPTSTAATLGPATIVSNPVSQLLLQAARGIFEAN